MGWKEKASTGSDRFFTVTFHPEKVGIKPL